MFIAFMDCIALGASLLICLSAETIGRRLGVMDVPDNGRKHHLQATPLVGGIGILLPFLLWLCGAFSGGLIGDSQVVLVFLLCSAGVGLVGFADDQTPTSPLSRFLALIVFLGVAIAIAPRLIAPTLNWGSFEPTTLPAFLYCGLIALTAVGIVNAVNMADGQNGLVPSLFAIWSLCLMLIGDPTVSAIAQTLALLSIVVLLFNLRGKLFLGDCGSYGVTFVMGLLALITYAQGRIALETIIVWFYVPVVDCLRLIITRRLQGRSPLAPDTDHFHHRLQVKFGAAYGLFAYIVLVAASSLVATLAPRFALVCVIVLTAVYFSFAFLTDSAVSEAGQADDTHETAADRTFANVVSLGSEQHQLRERAR